MLVAALLMKNRLISVDPKTPRVFATASEDDLRTRRLLFAAFRVLSRARWWSRFLDDHRKKERSNFFAPLFAVRDLSTSTSLKLVHCYRSRQPPHRKEPLKDREVCTAHLRAQIPSAK